MSERTLRVLLVVFSVMVAGAAGYLFGFEAGGSAFRGYEAAQDLLTPVENLRRDRMRHEGIRRVTRELAAFQESAYEERGELAGMDSIPVPTDGYIVWVFRSGSHDNVPQWGILVRDERKPRGEHCAVMLGMERAYVGGVVLRGAGRVRCSWDLATRINRLVG